MLNVTFALATHPHSIPFLPIALYSTGIFLALSAILFAWTLRTRQHFSFLRWLPLTTSLTLMAMIAITASSSFSHLNSASIYRNQCRHIISATQTFLDSNIDVRRGVRNFLLTGQDDSLKAYDSGIHSIPQEIKDLEQATAHDGEDQPSVQLLEKDSRDLTSYALQLISLRKQQGAQAAVQTETKNEGFTLDRNPLLNDFKTFIEKKNGQVTVSLLQTEKNLNYIFNLFITGSLLAAALLLTSNLFGHREMKERQRAERQLRLLQTCIDHLNEIVLVTEADQLNVPGPAIVYVNPAFEKITGYTAAEVIGKNPRFLQCKNTSRPVLQEIREALEARKPIRRDLINITKEGREFWLDIDIAPIFDTQGKCTHFAAIERDITEQKQADHALRQAMKETQDLRAALDEHAIVAITDQKGKIIYANDKFCAISQYSRSELLGQDHRIINSGYHSKEFFRDLWNTINDNKVWKGEIKNKAKGGINYWVDTTIIPFLEGNGTIRHFVAIRADITQRKRAENEVVELNSELEKRIAQRTLELSESERRAHFITEMMPQIIFTAKADGNVDYYNQRWVDYTGLSLHQARGLGWQTVVHPEELGHCSSRWSESVQTGKEYEIEYRLKRGLDSVYRWHLGRAFPLRNEHGEIVQWIGSCTDIQDLKEAEEKLKRAAEILESKVAERTLQLNEKNNQLMSAAEAKNNFLAMMSHELRTPLNAIIGFSEILVDGMAGEINEDQKEYVQEISDSGKNLLQLINDVLDLSKVEAGKMELHLETFSIPEAIKQVCSVIYPLSMKKQLRLTTTLAPELVEATIDEQRFKQILLNLLSNAVKFTPDGGMISIVGNKTGHTHFTVSVRDTGIGIKPENIDKLFKEFVQLDEGTTRNFQGTGLGLALIRNMVEMQEGFIDVASEFGKGSTFTFTLPLLIRNKLV